MINKRIIGDEYLRRILNTVGRIPGYNTAASICNQRVTIFTFNRHIEQ